MGERTDRHARHPLRPGAQQGEPGGQEGQYLYRASGQCQETGDGSGIRGGRPQRGFPLFPAQAGRNGQRARDERNHRVPFPRQDHDFPDAAKRCHDRLEADEAQLRGGIQGRRTDGHAFTVWPRLHLPRIVPCG